MSYFIHTTFISILLDPRSVDPRLTLMHTAHSAIQHRKDQGAASFKLSNRTPKMKHRFLQIRSFEIASIQCKPDHFHLRRTNRTKHGVHNYIQLNWTC